jgi:hypothetical protein
MNGRVYERFWAKVDCDGPKQPGFSTPCWLWTASTSQGYGRFGNWDDRSRTQLAHRVAYEMFVGPVPSGLTIDHLCRNALCVNPGHFELVTSGVNALRGSGPAAANARKTHCSAGHEFDAENTYLYKGRRECRACRREALRAWKRRQNGA